MMSAKMRVVYLLILQIMFFGVALSQVDAQPNGLTALYNCHYLKYPSQIPTVYRSGAIALSPLEDDRSILYGSTGFSGSILGFSIEIQKARILGSSQSFRLCSANLGVTSSDPYLSAHMGGGCENGPLYAFGQAIAWGSVADTAAGEPHRWAQCTVVVYSN